MLPEETQKAIDAILAAPTDTVSDLIAEMRNRKQLSQVVHALNDSVLGGAPDQRDRARQALSVMGFVAE